MTIISSKDNRIIKEAASLADKKHRDELGEYLLEGPNIVKEAMQQGGRVRFIFIKAGAESAEINEIISMAEERNLAAYELTSDAFAKVTQTDTPQSVAAVFEKRQMQADEFFNLVGDGNVLVLDRLQDPGNVGTILRSAEAFGFKGVISMKGTADVYQPKIVRAAAGSILRLPLLFASEAEEAEKLLEKHGKTVLVASMEGESISKTDISSGIAVIIGNEGNGPSEAFRRNAGTISIPMSGQTESLNAAIAASIIMYESQRQRLS